MIIQVIKLSYLVDAQFTGSFSVASRNGESEVVYLDNALSSQESVRLIREAAEAWKAKV